jgi:hypothetical protein
VSGKRPGERLSAIRYLLIGAGPIIRARQERPVPRAATRKRRSLSYATTTCHSTLPSIASSSSAPSSRWWDLPGFGTLRCHARTKESEECVILFLLAALGEMHELRRQFPHCAAPPQELRVSRRISIIARAARPIINVASPARRYVTSKPWMRMAVRWQHSRSTPGHLAQGDTGRPLRLWGIPRPRNIASAARCWSGERAA